MKDTRKLSLIYFVISLVMLAFVCFGCEGQPTEEPYIAKYEINHETKTIEIEFGDYFKGNKSAVCHQIQELKDVENYQCNIK